jgi:hypothetical protein
MSEDEPIIAPSALKHGLTEPDILHAYRNPIRAYELDEDLTMLIGGDTTGRLCEIGVVAGAEAFVIVHAMPARSKFLR